ncbi:MAG: hypothetical protein AB1861_07300 [Cyanobacteriota bacterium]
MPSRTQPTCKRLGFIYFHIISGKLPIIRETHPARALWRINPLAFRGDRFNSSGLAFHITIRKMEFWQN